MRTLLQPQRRDCFGQLNLADIKVGTVIRRHHESGTTNSHRDYFVVGAPYLAGEQYLGGGMNLWMRLISLGYGFEDKSALSDMGVFPYPNGYWNSVNHVTSAPPLELGAINLRDFFDQLSTTLIGYAGKLEGKFVGDIELAVQVPQRLWSKLPCTKLTYDNVSGSHNVTFRVTLVH